MRAAIYCRISSDPTEDAAGVSRQEADCREFVQREGWQVSRVYTDNDTSASQPMERRPAFMQLLADAEDAKFDAIVAWRDDRLWRDVDHQRTVFALCNQVGIETVATPSAKYDPADVDDRFVSGIRALVAEYEAATTAIRVRRALAQRASEGKPHPGRRPFGYTSWRMDEVDPVEADAIREAADRIIAGETVRAVRLDFDRRGIGPPGGGDQWSTFSFANMLRSPRLAGKMVHRGEVIGEGDWTPILSPERHDRLVAAMDGAKRRGGRKGGRPAAHFLTGLARCSKCGHGMYAGNHPRAGRRYVCKRDSAAGACGGLTIGADETDRLVAGAVIDWIAEGNLDTLAEPSEDDLAVETELAEVEDRMARLSHDFYVEDALPRDEYEAARTALQDRARALRKRLRADHAGNVLDGIPRTRDALEDAWLAHVDDVDWQRAVFRLTATHVDVYPAKPGAKSIDPERLHIGWIDK